MEKPKATDLRMSIDVNNFETLFSEIAQIDANSDRIIISFLQHLPGDDPKQPNAKVVSRIALTWPHFARILTMLNSTMDKGREHAKTQFLRDVCPGENDHE